MRTGIIQVIIVMLKLSKSGIIDFFQTSLPTFVLFLLFYTFFSSINVFARQNHKPAVQELSATPNCAKNYKKALSLSYKKYAQPLTYAVTISHRQVKVFPGHWMVRPSLKLTGHKKRSKRLRRRDKSGIELVSNQSSEFSALDYTAQEKQILKIADSIVRWRGKDPAFNKKGRYGWLTTRIAADLKTYMRQPDHPALCTGAIGMMDYLYKHSGRFRRRVALINQLSPLAHQYAAARYRAFKHILSTGHAPLFVKIGASERYASLNTLMTRTASLLSKPLLRSINQENLFLPTLEIFKRHAALEPSPKITGTHSRTVIILPTPRPAPFSTSEQRKVKKHVVKTVYSHKETSAVMGHFPHSSRHKFTALTREALRKTLSAIEAAYYIDHIAQSYKALSDSIYGAISEIRKSHASHCICSE